MTVPTMEQPTIERLKTMLADQLITIESQAQYAQTLIKWGTALEAKVAELEASMAGGQNKKGPGANGKHVLVDESGAEVSA